MKMEEFYFPDPCDVSLKSKFVVKTDTDIKILKSFFS
jgi:hypothetical protein